VAGDSVGITGTLGITVAAVVAIFVVIGRTGSVGVTGREVVCGTAVSGGFVVTDGGIRVVKTAGGSVAMGASVIEDGGDCMRMRLLPKVIEKTFAASKARTVCFILREWNDVTRG
jgi:hypothetical protein